jgi:hypothetical protein
LEMVCRRWGAPGGSDAFFCISPGGLGISGLPRFDILGVLLREKIRERLVRCVYVVSDSQPIKYRKTRFCTNEKGDTKLTH